MRFRHLAEFLLRIYRAVPAGDHRFDSDPLQWRGEVIGSASLVESPPSKLMEARR
jgi:hypothetical protein